MAKYDFSGRALDTFAGHFMCHVIGPLFKREAEGGKKQAMDNLRKQDAQREAR